MGERIKEKELTLKEIESGIEHKVNSNLTEEEKNQIDTIDPDKKRLFGNDNVLDGFF